MSEVPSDRPLSPPPAAPAASATSPTPQRRDKPCSSCRELISSTASKCHHCEAYQDWRRHLFLGDASLSIVVALIAVITAAIPVLAGVFRADYSNVEISAFGDRDQLFIVYRNRGTKEALILDVEIASINRLDAPESVDPGRLYIDTAYEITDALESTPNGASLPVTIVVLEYDGSRKRHEFEITPSNDGTFSMLHGNITSIGD